MPTVEPGDTQVVIIGAGQAGLSTAYHLTRLGLLPGVDVLVVDRGPSTGGAWQHRWSALRVGDTHKIHDLPGMSEAGLSFASAPRDQPAREVVREYYAAYERHFGLEVLRPATVVAVTSAATALTTADVEAPRGFLVTVRTEEQMRRYRSAVVVNASGTWRRPRIPAVAGRDVFSGRQVTTPEYSDAHDFAGQRVAIVGAGTSALGFLDELSAVGAHTEWFTRREPAFTDEGPDLSQDRGKAAVRRQDEAARAGRRLPSIAGSTGLPRNAMVRRLDERGVLVRRPMFARLVSDGAITTNGAHIPLDAVVWAAGFDAELDHLDPLALNTSRGGIVVSDGESADHPGLFLAGYGPQASTIGANRAGRAMAKHIMQRLH